MVPATYVIALRRVYSYIHHKFQILFFIEQNSCNTQIVLFLFLFSHEFDEALVQFQSKVNSLPPSHYDVQEAPQSQSMSLARYVLQGIWVQHCPDCKLFVGFALAAIFVCA